jgi:hypothetical protein
LIVLDTLARCTEGADENSSRDMGAAVAAADVLRFNTGAAVVFVHHTRKDGEVERGSGALRGALDAMLMIKRDAGDTRCTVHCEKMKDAARFASFALELHSVKSTDSCALVTATGTLQLRDGTLTPMQRTALDALQRSALDDGLTATLWQKMTGGPERSFYAAVKALVTLGYVDRDRRGRGARYSVSDAGLEALKS